MKSGKIPDDVIAAVIARADIVEVVGKSVHLTKRGRNYIGLCPFHSEKTPSFNVNPEKQIYHCFGCGAGGNVIWFVKEIEGLTYREAVRQLAEEANVPWHGSDQPQEETPEQAERRAIIEGHELAARIYHYVLKNTAEGQQAMQYLRSRGFTDKWIDDFQIGYAPSSWDTLVRYLSKNGFDPALMEKGGLIVRRAGSEGYYDRFRHRVMFPMHDARGRTIAFSGRALDEDGPKYLNSPETPVFNKSRTLFNLHRARPSIRRTGTVILFEGHVDVIRAFETGTGNAVATMGTALTAHHASAIRRLANQVILCYDGDDAGQTAAVKSMELLEQEGCTVRVALLPDRLDPDEYIARHGAESFRTRIIEGAVSATKFRLIDLKRAIPPTTDEKRLKYVQAALRIVAGLQAPTEREFYIRELSADYQFSMEALNEQLHLIRRQMQKNGIRRDNQEISWNNVMQSESGMQGVPALLPAYHNAERKLLAAMLENRDIAQYVQDQLADRFNVEAHAAIAAFLYAYYEQGNEPDSGRFIAGLADDRLIAVASRIAFLDTAGISDMQVVDDYIHEIRKYPKQQEIKKKKEEQEQAIRSGDMNKAAQIGMEIISLEKQLKR